MSQTDLAVIGAGPGGYTAAFLAADLGLKVALIDRRVDPGGVCLYEGCIPSKAYLHAASLIQETKGATNMGLDFGKPGINIKRLREWKTEVVHKLTSGLGQLGRSRKVNYIRGSAAFLSPNELKIDSQNGGEQLSFDHAIIATGSEPTKLPLFPDSPLVMDSSEALKLEAVPRRLVVVGGGYIGLEMGTVYASLGAKVTVVEMADQILPGTDPDLVRLLARRLDGLMEKIYLNTQVIEAREENNHIWVKLQENGKSAIEKSFDKMLFSVGRRPNLEGVGLENTAVQLTDKGFVQVDERRRSTEPSIYAIGDVSGPPMLAHKASHEGRVAVEAICGHKVAFAPYAIPAVVFTDPELAYCGMMEAEAKARGYAVQIARFPWSASGRALSVDATEGMTKMVMDQQNGRLLGIGIVGRGAGELIAEGVLAIEMGALAKDVALSIHPHPTLSESLMECSEIFSGQSTHVYRPRPK